MLKNAIIDKLRESFKVMLEPMIFDNNKQLSINNII